MTAQPAPPSETVTPSPPPAPWQIVLGVALGCVVLALLAQALVQAPFLVCPVNPAAGLALGAVLVFGHHGLAGVLLAGAVLPLLLSYGGLGPGDLSVVQQWGLGLGAAAQAWLGRMLIQRALPHQEGLTTPRAIVLAGLLGGLLASVVSPTVEVLLHSQAGQMNANLLPGLWLACWLADATGVLLFAPVVLSFFGQPSSDWRLRRRWVAVPLLLALVLLGVSTLAFERLQSQRAMATFERDASRLANSVEARLTTPLLALRALHSVAASNPQPDSWGFQQATDGWLAQPDALLAMGMAQVQTLPGSAPPTPALVVQQVLPLPANRPLLGLNLLAQGRAGEAVQAAAASGQPAASTGWLVPGLQQDDTTVVLFQALYRSRPADREARLQQFTGTVFLGLSMQRALTGLREPDLQHMDWCLLGGEAGAAAPRRRAGPEGCEQRIPRKGPFHQARPLLLADLPLELHISSSSERLPSALTRVRWMVPMTGLMASALLGALLLVLTGQSRRTEQAVEARTSELRREMAERAQAQEALNASEERMRAMLDNLPLGIALMDATGRLLECNPQLCNMLGRSTEHLRGEPVMTCFDPGEASRIRELGKRLLSQRSAVDSVDSLKLRAANGRLTDVRVVASALYQPDGRIAHVVAAVQDMTAHHQLLQSELALNRAEEANRAKNEFVSRMSHELRTPLNAMIGFAQLLALNESPKLPPRQLEWTQQIQRAGWHLLAMINDTLDLARIESGATRLSLESVQLSPLLTACRDWVQQGAAQRGVNLRLVVDRDASTVLADSTRLKQVLTNLLSNAIKYNRDTGSVEIRARKGEAGFVDIVVKDSGLGMTSEQLSLLFQPYNRLGRENSSIEGSGIGLVISRRLAELMGGTLRVQSAPGEGSEFTLSLPATVEPGPADALSEPPGPGRYQRRLVHYVEDNATNIEVMRGVLLQRSQITLQTSTLGLDGLSAIRHSRPDLILLDMQLPDISGLELLRHILRDDQIASIPVIVVSADATPQNMERALTLGAKHYVTKPVDVASFLALVDRVLEENHSLL